MGKTHQQLIYMWKKGYYTCSLTVLNPKPKPAARIHEGNGLVVGKKQLIFMIS